MSVPVVRFLLLGTLLAGCSKEPEIVRYQLCNFGAGEFDTGANPWVDEACEALPNVIRNPENGRAGFRIYELSDMRAAAIEALDVDGDGVVTVEDHVVLDVLGYSWGGVNTAQLDLAAQEGVDHPSPIGRKVLIDPFIPPHDELLSVAGDIEAVWSYGHSVAPGWDCSTGAPLAPYRSRPLDCDSTEASCLEYDLSIDRTVGHCTIVVEVIDWAVENLLEGTTPAPASLLRP